MRGAEVIITDRGAIRLEGGPVAKPHPVEAVIARMLARVGLVPHQKAGPAVTVYVAEELLFCKQFSLPVKGSGIKQAIGYQLEMLLPFPNNACFFSYVTERRKKETAVTLYAVPEEFITPHLQELAESGHSLAGLFPLSQRYLNRRQGKKKWALLLPGRMNTLLTFVNGRLSRRLLCPSSPTVKEARELSGCDTVYCPKALESDGFAEAESLLADAPLGKAFNLLPASYRRPDYFKFVVAGLAILNVLSLFLLVGIKEYRFQATSSRVEAEIARLQPEMKKVNALGSKEDRIRKEIARLEEIGRNPDLLAVLTGLTDKLPPSAYLDQLRMEKKEAAILYLDGYADDMGEMSTSLQGLGEVSLKSTSRRNNKNYFQMEINLP
ncbi:MAG: hypothetical protein OEV89_00015 [Desulfobulbaceae bacterium]|nr:hypothetical protein [Desulfobulbaceae bacterium]HIJ89226.1 hypothetical protein [Deltaproteobacteria bacterium]